MCDNSYKPIDNINVNDILYNDNKVLGIIIIEPLQIYKYTLGNETFKASEHIYMFNHANTMTNKIKSDSNVVYHLLTEQRNFYINNTLFHDYDYALEKISHFNDIKVIGNSKDKGAILTFVMENIHPNDASMILDQHNVCIRTGHHCAQPLLTKLNLTSTARASFGIYNDKQDIDYFIDAIKETKLFFK